MLLGLLIAAAPATALMPPPVPADGYVCAPFCTNQNVRPHYLGAGLPGPTGSYGEPGIATVEASSTAYNDGDAWGSTYTVSAVAPGASASWNHAADHYRYDYDTGGADRSESGEDHFRVCAGDACPEARLAVNDAWDYDALSSSSSQDFGVNAEAAGVAAGYHEAGNSPNHRDGEQACRNLGVAFAEFHDCYTATPHGAQPAQETRTTGARLDGPAPAAVLVTWAPDSTSVDAAGQSVVVPV